MSHAIFSAKENDMANSVDIPDSGFLKVKIADFAGSGVQSVDDGVAMAFRTEGGPSIDVTMTKEQAKYLASELTKAAK